MIREILEQQGYCFGYDYLNGASIYKDEGGTLVYVSGLFSVGFTSKEKLYEQACREYVLENGFKLDWFDEYIKYLWNTSPYNKKYFLQTIIEEEWKNLTIYQSKLIAWLYANDIKVVE